MFYLDLFFQYTGQYLKTKFQYRANFFLSFVSDLMAQAVNLIFIILVFNHTSLIEGWNRNEIVFIYGFFLVPFALFVSFFNIWDFNDRYIVKGEFDRILTRPIHSLFQVVLEKMELESLLGAITGFIIMVYAGSNLGLSLTWYDPILFILMALGGMLVYAGIFIILASIGFWSDARTSIMPLMYNIGNYGRYPINIYHPIIRFVLTWVLPFAFVGVYPAAYFLRRSEWYLYSFFTPVMGLIVFIVAVCIWNIGVKKYRGAGN